MKAGSEPGGPRTGIWAVLSPTLLWPEQPDRVPWHSGGLKQTNRKENGFSGLWGLLKNRKQNRKKERTGSHVKQCPSNHYVTKAGACLYHPSTKVSGWRVCPPTSGWSPLKPRRLSRLASGPFHSQVPACLSVQVTANTNTTPAPSLCHNPHPQTGKGPKQA